MMKDCETELLNNNFFFRDMWCSHNSHIYNDYDEYDTVH